MKDISEKISGIKIFKVHGEKCLALGSRTVKQEDVDLISTVENISKILFYSITFKAKDLESLKNTLVRHVSIKHGNFSDQEFLQLCRIPTIKVIDLHDTLVTNEQIDKIKKENSDILINVKSFC